MTESVEKKGVVGFIERLAEASRADRENALYRRASRLASRPRRSRITVSLGKLGRCAKENEVVIVPGKVLGNGNVGKRISVCAMEYSGSALRKLRSAGCEVLDVDAAIRKGGARLIA